MSNAPLTPIDDPEPTSPVIDYSPATVAYDEAFENALMNAILYPPSSTSQPVSKLSNSPPLILPTMLPVPLTSPLRTHPSPIPGLLLTHVHGYHTGGPGPSPATVADLASKFISENDIQDAGQLERVVEERIKEKIEEVRERMREREEAVKKNEELERQLRDLEAQRSVEARVKERILESKKGRKG
ncbi:hypothetical protein CC78DRAFT_215055 [Lojkania enalia]|uniref:Uncharacterized protein n=1 Tax=Lojkania enalia TaxID=147567 RepID=A0A9P4N6M8_9PLEO|nr:hypothetical protein CC78DRAFT_215055 [Didymosphaeria enalia]